MSILAITAFLTINIVSFVRNDKSRIVYFLSFLYLFILCAGNYYNADYENYARTYSIIAADGWWSYKEVLYVFLMRLLAFNPFYTFSYQAFVVFETFIAFMLFRHTINRYSDNGSVVLFLYLLYPAFHNFIGLRHMLAVHILLFSLQYLVFEKKFATAKFFLIIIAACCIHMSFAFFIPFYFFNKLTIKQAQIFTAITTSFTVFIARTNILPFVASALGFSKISAYIRDDLGMGFIIYFVFYIVFYFLLLFCKKVIIDTENKTIIIAPERSSLFDLNRFVIVAEKLNLYVFLSFPLLMITASFKRYSDPVVLCNYILLSIILQRLSVGKRIIVLVCIMIFTISCTIFFMRTGPLVILQNNLIF